MLAKFRCRGILTCHQGQHWFEVKGLTLFNGGFALNKVFVKLFELDSNISYLVSHITGEDRVATGLRDGYSGEGLSELPMTLVGKRA